MTSFKLITTDRPIESPEQWRDLVATTVERLDPASEDWPSVGSALTMLLVDAMLAGDTSVLEAAGGPLRDRLALLRSDRGSVDQARGWLIALLETVRWALSRLPSPEEVAVGDGQDRRFLEYLDDHGRSSSADLRRGIPTADAQLSRIGRKLLAAGFVVQHRVGREAQWDLTPRGRQLMRQISQYGDGTDGGGLIGTPSPQTSRSGHPARGSSRVAASSGRGTGGRTGRAVAGARMFRDGGSAARAVGSKAPVADARASESRYIVQVDQGWQIKKTVEGRTVETRRTKKEAVARAKEILENVGGGQVLPVDASGKQGKPISVSVARR